MLSTGVLDWRANHVDMINILKFPYTPKTCCWVHEPGAGQTLLAVSDMASPTIRIYDGRGDGTPLFELDKLHRAPVHLISVSLALVCKDPWYGGSS